jgi:hypothetical protein
MSITMKTGYAEKPFVNLTQELSVDQKEISVFNEFIIIDKELNTERQMEKRDYVIELCNISFFTYVHRVLKNPKILEVSCKDRKVQKIMNERKKEFVRVNKNYTLPAEKE